MNLIHNTLLSNLYMNGIVMSFLKQIVFDYICYSSADGVFHWIRKIKTRRPTDSKSQFDSINNDLKIFSKILRVSTGISPTVLRLILVFQPESHIALKIDLEIINKMF
jgi:hypothetical protein